MLNHTNDLDSRHCRPHRLPLVSTVAVLLCLTLAPTTARKMSSSLRHVLLRGLYEGLR